MNNNKKTNKQTKQLYRRINSIKVPYSSKTPSLAESNFCKKSPSEFNYYLSNETIPVLVLSEACVAILFAYKCLYSFVKALDEIKKKMQTVLMPFVGSLEPLDHLLLKCQ